ncbi:hypothetical protein BDZ97DRAFT_1657605 [Flammula alnicola]|nr:hypothetical protein BDZ97DRAFT_1657605 [Flammula alnicola]
MYLLRATSTISARTSIVRPRSLSSIGSFKHRSTSAREFKVILDNDTLYIEQPLAEALGWKPDVSSQGIPLTLSGWQPHYFAITRTGTDADLLARETVESSRDPRVQEILQYLKDSDAKS